MGQDGGDDIQGSGNDDGVDDFSDVSDDSDLCHVEAKDVGAPRTDEDKEMAIIDSIASHLRDRPLLPPDGGYLPGDRVFGNTATDQGRLQMQSGCRMPTVHCGFKGCHWTCDAPITRHMEMERLLCVHLAEKHRNIEMALVPEDAWPVADEDYGTRGICAIHLTPLVFIELYRFQPEVSVGALCLGGYLDRGHRPGICSGNDVPRDVDAKVRGTTGNQRGDCGFEGPRACTLLNIWFVFVVPGVF